MSGAEADTHNRRANLISAVGKEYNPVVQNILAVTKIPGFNLGHKTERRGEKKERMKR